MHFTPIALTLLSYLALVTATISTSDPGALDHFVAAYVDSDSVSQTHEKARFENLEKAGEAASHHLHIPTQGDVNPGDARAIDHHSSASAFHFINSQSSSLKAKESFKQLDNAQDRDVKIRHAKQGAEHMTAADQHLKHAVHHRQKTFEARRHQPYKVHDHLDRNATNAPKAYLHAAVKHAQAAVQKAAERDEAIAVLKTVPMDHAAMTEVVKASANAETSMLKNEELRQKYRTISNDLYEKETAERTAEMKTRRKAKRKAAMTAQVEQKRQQI